MKLTRHDLVEKLIFVNMAFDKHGLPQFGYDYNPKDRRMYCLMRFSVKEVKWVQVTDSMSLSNLWHFLDGMLTTCLYLEERQ
jgi:hypothetical protein